MCKTSDILLANHRLKFQLFIQTDLQQLKFKQSIGLMLRHQWALKLCNLFAEAMFITITNRLSVWWSGLCRQWRFLSVCVSQRLSQVSFKVIGLFAFMFQQQLQLGGLGLRVCPVTVGTTEDGTVDSRNELASRYTSTWTPMFDGLKFRQMRVSLFTFSGRLCRRRWLLNRIVWNNTRNYKRLWNCKVNTKRCGLLLMPIRATLQSALSQAHICVTAKYFDNSTSLYIITSKTTRFFETGSSRKTGLSTETQENMIHIITLHHDSCSNKT